LVVRGDARRATTGQGQGDNRVDSQDTYFFHELYSRDDD
jgi:hypothetical protein